MASLENENEVLKQQVKDLKKELEKKAEEEKSKDEDSEGRYVLKKAFIYLLLSTNNVF